MKTDERAEAWYYVISAASTLVLTGFVVWKVYLGESDRATIRRWLKKANPLWGLRTRRDGQIALTWEVIQAQDALAMYDAGHVDLRAALGVPAGDRP